MTGCRLTVPNRRRRFTKQNRNVIRIRVIKCSLCINMQVCKHIHTCANTLGLEQQGRLQVNQWIND